MKSGGSVFYLFTLNFQCHVLVVCIVIVVTCTVDILQRPRGTQSLLLSGPGSEMPCIQSHWPTLQNQAHLTAPLLLLWLEIIF